MPKDNKNRELVFIRKLTMGGGRLWGRGGHRNNGGGKETLQWRVWYWNVKCMKFCHEIMMPKIKL